jgi:twitching motility protein PilT
MAASKQKGTAAKLKLGEMLVKHKVITKGQMKTAIERQKSMGGRLGQNLIYLDFVDEKVLLKFLANQLKINCINLNTMEISPETQKLIPLDTMQRMGVLPVRKEKKMLYVGMTDPTNLEAIKELEFSLGMKVVPLAMAESQWIYASAFFLEKGWGKAPLTKTEHSPRVQADDYSLLSLMQDLLSDGGSDIHLSPGVAPTFRIHHQLHRLDYPSLTAARIQQLLFDVLQPQQRQIVESRLEADLALSVEKIGRFRLNTYHQRGDLAATLRYVVDDIPTLKDLNIPPWMTEFTSWKQGLILITSPSGHGKSTTIASLIDAINSTRRVNIVTLEDPIEFIHSHRMSNVNQRELGTDTASFHDGIKYIFRQDPDVISIGDMRDLESVSTALTAAETGHLVIAAMHTSSATVTIDRIIDIFPADQQNQVRNQLADSLLVIFSQRLVPRADGKGRVLAYEKLVNSYRIQNAIREERVHLIKTHTSGSHEDFSSIESGLAPLVKRGVITYDEGRKFAQDPKAYDLLTRK